MIYCSKCKGEDKNPTLIKVEKIKNYYARVECSNCLTFIGYVDKETAIEIIKEKRRYKARQSQALSAFFEVGNNDDNK